TDGEKHIYEKLQAELTPTKLSVTDSSGGCGSMYVVEIEAECFRGLTRVKQTKMVNSLLKEELKEMHGMRVLCSV
ncbi:bola-like protein, partial [Martensiomyces pterosporus]